MRAQKVFEFGKGTNPLKTMDLGIDKYLEQEDQKHEWDLDIDWIYTYDSTVKIYDIINFYGIYIKVMKGDNGYMTTFTGGLDDVDNDNDVEFEDEPQLVFNEMADYLKMFFKDFINKSIKPYSIAGRIDLSKYQD